MYTVSSIIWSILLGGLVTYVAYQVYLEYHYRTKLGISLFLLYRLQVKLLFMFIETYIEAQRHKEEEIKFYEDQGLPIPDLYTKGFWYNLRNK